jgi:rhamnosyltransferase
MGGTMKKTVSVVIRAYNEGAHLGRLLDGLSQQTVQPDEIIIVDSGSTDDTAQIAIDAGHRVVPIAKESFSFGRSLNYGCEVATGEILLIMSAHVFPIYETYLEKMLSGFEDSAHPSRAGASIVYGRQVGDHRTKFSETRVMLKWFPDESIWDQKSPFSNNANAAVLREVWESFQYDEDLTGLEDLDFANRVIGAGGRVAYVAEAPVVHVHEETWATIRNRYKREAIAYKRIVKNSQMSAMKSLRLAAQNIVNDYWHAKRAGELRANLASIPRFRVAQFYGAWEGFRIGTNVSSELLRRFYYPTDLSRSAPEADLGRQLDYSHHGVERRK